MTNHWLGVFCGLASAFVWGGGDFSGGVASRKHHPFQVLAWSAISGSLLLLFLVWLTGEGWPPAGEMLWAAAAGLAGAIGIIGLYRGLAEGQAAVVAPLAAVLSATIPAGFSLLTEGLPSLIRLFGIGLAIGGIWLTSQGVDGSGRTNRLAVGLAIVAGLGFGGFFILLSQLQSNAIFMPLLVARLVNLLLAFLLLKVRLLPLPQIRQNPIALLAGLLDVGGNLFFMLAQQYTRLDVASVLASLYPATTVLLAYFLHKERISAGQWRGAGLCLLAVIAIAVG